MNLMGSEAGPGQALRPVERRIKNDGLFGHFRHNKSIVMDYARPYRDTLRDLGRRARELRLLRNVQQAELARRAGIGVATLQRFEKTGTASLETVLRIATALHAEQAFDKLFEAPPYASMDEALARPQRAQRQRAPKRK